MDLNALSTHQKALSVNLNPNLYGSFAEIGAGQEVVRHFFHVGAAAGTVAKSMSAYDMQFSDAIYGREENGRYVCESRVEHMLTHEYDLIVKRLWETRAEKSCFFVFADTVATKSFANNNLCHGWLGMKFQTKSLGEANEVIIHIRLLDQNMLMQQEVLGVIGVNLIYACFNYYEDIDRFIHSLTENIANDRIRIDILKLNGPDFEKIDNRLVALKLVELGLTKAIMFNPEGQVTQSADMLRKKSLLVQRGSFRPVTFVNMDMQRCGLDNFLREPNVEEEKTLVLMEITLSNLREGNYSHQDFLNRIDLLCALGFPVLISNFKYLQDLAVYIRTYTKEPTTFITGVTPLQQLIQEFIDSERIHELLDMFAKVFQYQGKIYVYPECINKGNELRTSKDLQFPENVHHLFQYCWQNNLINDLTDCDISKLHIFSKEVLEMIHSGNSKWETMVPEKVAAIIKQKGLWLSNNN